MLFKNAYVRGIQSALINGNYAAFPDESTATKIADHIAGQIDFDPSNVSREVTYKIATEITSASDWLKANRPHLKAASFTKLASWDDVYKLADHHAVLVMEKAAEGSNYEGGDKGNKDESSAEGKMDKRNRPDGYAENSLGTTEQIVPAGAAVGKEQVHPMPPSETPNGTNSAVEWSKKSSLQALFRKAAEGSNYTGGDKGNKEPTTAEGKMDRLARPEGYAENSLGTTEQIVPPGASVGKEQVHPMPPSETPSGTNSAVEWSKQSSQDPYVALFKKTASEIVQYIPDYLSEDEKIAHVRACMGMTQDEKARYLGQVQYDAKVAAESSGRHLHSQTPAGKKNTPGSTAATYVPTTKRYDGRKSNQKAAEDEKLPPFMRKNDDGDKDGDDDDKKRGEGGLPSFIQDKIDAKKGDQKSDDDKGDENANNKDDDEKKEAMLRSHVSRISAALRGAR